MSTLPLAGYRHPGDEVLIGAGRSVTAAQFLAQARRLAHALPEGNRVINLCETRHGFMLGFAAALMRGQVSLLPAGRGARDWEVLLEGHAGSHVLSERAVATVHAFALGAFLEDTGVATPDALDIPAIDSAAVAAILFTSGSTGEPAAHSKTWGQLCRGAHLLAAALGWKEGRASAIVGSVPPQHMFGFEATVMLALRAGVPVHAHVPLLAADLVSAVGECGRPAWWMTTPMHLRAPLNDAAALPGLEGVVASTMSLPPALASAAEAAWRVPVIEIYGSTETGALATRRTARDTAWTPLPGVTLRAQGEGEARRFRVDGPHVGDGVMLDDALELLADGRFHWLGRSSDMVKVGGKRASLSALNLAIGQIPGVADSVFAFPPRSPGAEDDMHPAQRLAAFFVSETLEASQVLAALRSRIDPAFLPRPIHRVSRLPRNANGKIPRSALAELFAQCRPAQSIPPDHPALPGHFPGDPMVPGVTVLARVADALRVRFARQQPGELRHARFHVPLRAGEPFTIETRLEKGLARFEVRHAGPGGAVIASGEWSLQSTEPGKPGE